MSWIILFLAVFGGGYGIGFIMGMLTMTHAFHENRKDETP